MIVKDLLNPYASEFAEKCRKAGRYLDKNEIKAINFLTKKLIENNLWDKFAAIYPFVGKSAVTHSFNLKSSLRHTIRWFNESFLVHNKFGVTNYGQGYGNTFVAPGIFSDNNIHVSVYNATYWSYLSDYSPIIGSSSPFEYASKWIHTIFLKYSRANTVWTYSCGPASLGSNFFATNFSLAGEDAGDFLHAQVYGLVVGCNSNKCYVNGKIFGISEPANRPAKSIPLNQPSSDPVEGVRYDWTQYPFMLFTHRAFGDPSVGYANANIRFATIGYGLNDYENEQFYNIVEEFQTILDRNVGTIKLLPDDINATDQMLTSNLDINYIYERPLISGQNILHKIESELQIADISVEGPRRVYASDNIGFGVTIQQFQELD